MQSLKHMTFFSIVWSKDWKKKVPWSVDQKPMPYFGSRLSEKASGYMKVFTIGPIAICIVKT